MTDVIWKQKLILTDVQTVSIPCDAEILCVQMQNEVPCIWFRHSGTQEDCLVELHFVGTGCPFDSKLVLYVGTVQIKEFVFHLFQKPI